MFCWQARARFADHLDKAAAFRPEGAGMSRLDRHLASCASCRAEVDALNGIRSLLADAAPALAGPGFRPGQDRMDDALFEQTVLGKARARKAAAAPGVLPRMPPSFARPIPLGAALSLMIVAVTLAHFLVGTGTDLQGTRPAQELAGSLDDSVAPPQEVPFVVQQDLVGARRGSIPLTTYVLEPAPREKPIMRASL